MSAVCQTILPKWRTLNGEVTQLPLSGRKRWVETRACSRSLTDVHIIAERRVRSSHQGRLARGERAGRSVGQCGISLGRAQCLIRRSKIGWGPVLQRPSVFSSAHEPSHFRLYAPQLMHSRPNLIPRSHGNRFGVSVHDHSSRLDTII